MNLKKGLINNQTLEIIRKRISYTSISDNNFIVFSPVLMFSNSTFILPLSSSSIKKSDILYSSVGTGIPSIGYI